MTPSDYYKNNRNTYKAKKEQLLKKSRRFGLLRLISFLLTLFGVYHFYGNWTPFSLISVFGLLLFSTLIYYHHVLKNKKNFYEKLENINQEELNMLSGNYATRPTGEAFLNPNHFYSNDIDLFGKGSFFQFLNRTATNEGKQKLATLMLSNDIQEIEHKQEAIKELGQHMDWIQHFTASAHLMEVTTNSKTITGWLNKYTPFIPSYFNWLPTLFSLLSIVIITLSLLSLLPSSVVIYWLMFGLLITLKYTKKINRLALDVNTVVGIFKQYSPLLEKIESASFKAPLLVKMSQKIKSNKGLKASKIFNLFSKTVDALNNRNNMLVALFGNGFLLWDVRQVFKIEQWITNYKEVINEWFEVVSFFDAYHSLSILAFNQTEYCYPSIKNTATIITAENLGHPLIDKSQRVASNVTIGQDQFFIVTGANMAGKSTFLRTLSLHIVMANMGLPICATASTYSPIKLITSMRTNDSLTENSSYFFSELTRLKFIINALQKDRYFVILDEILKGTNSVDKAIGSAQFVEKLTALNAAGIIATHDLSLCKIEKKSKQVINYYFDTTIKEDELYFDYTLKKGICKNMNASFLLKKMEIT